MSYNDFSVKRNILTRKFAMLNLNTTIFLNLMVYR